MVGTLPSDTVTTEVNCSLWLSAWSNVDGLDVGVPVVEPESGFVT
jgi:hypothetical protein